MLSDLAGDGLTGNGEAKPADGIVYARRLLTTVSRSGERVALAGAYLMCSSKEWQAAHGHVVPIPFVDALSELQVIHARTSGTNSILHRNSEPRHERFTDRHLTQAAVVEPHRNEPVELSPWHVAPTFHGQSIRARKHDGGTDKDAVVAAFSDAVKALALDVRCPHCGNFDHKLIELFGAFWYCSVCARKWPTH